MDAHHATICIISSIVSVFNLIGMWLSVTQFCGKFNGKEIVDHLCVISNIGYLENEYHFLCKCATNNNCSSYVQ